LEEVIKTSGIRVANKQEILARLVNDKSWRDVHEIYLVGLQEYRQAENAEHTKKFDAFKTATDRIDAAIQKACDEIMLGAEGSDVTRIIATLNTTEFAS
jgi:hypothetical protein